MPEADLDRAVRSLTAELAPELIQDARRQAVADVRAELTRRLTDALLRRCAEEMAGAEPDPDPAAENEAAGPSPATPADHPAGEDRPAPLSHPLAERAMREANGHYVYGVVPAGASIPPDLVGVEPTSVVGLVEKAGLAALVSVVPMSEFDEASLRENLNDVGWLEEKARAHEQVLEAVLAESAVVPLRLCTVFAGEDQVREMLLREHDVLTDALARLRGKAEWGVKAYAEPGALEREAMTRAEEAEEQGHEVSAGTAYMNRRRREARAREEAEELADEWTQMIHGGLAAIAEEALLNPLQRPELSGHEGEMLLNGVYLVEEEEAAVFRSAVVALAEESDRRGIEIVLTGPWPAYNFVKGSIEAAR